MNPQELPTVSQYLKAIPADQHPEAFGTASYRKRYASARRKGDHMEETCCCLCGRKNAKGVVYVTNMNKIVADPSDFGMDPYGNEEESAAAEAAGYSCDDLMFYPIGSDCEKKLKRRGLKKPNELV